MGSYILSTNVEKVPNRDSEFPMKILFLVDFYAALEINNLRAFSNGIALAYII
jgi:hypothetical protein